LLFILSISCIQYYWESNLSKVLSNLKMPKRMNNPTGSSVLHERPNDHGNSVVIVQTTTTTMSVWSFIDQRPPWSCGRRFHKRSGRSRTFGRPLNYRTTVVFQLFSQAPPKNGGFGRLVVHFFFPVFNNNYVWLGVKVLFSML
jgi:hypothetical protein